ncbi:MAG: ABC transporter permease [Flavipsychrobacter sp.]|nr:ABC transporter permease [Flavipsychrobacter sp.]
MQQLLFNITLAFRAIRNNKLRSILTISIIGLGIMALVGILTAIEVMKSAVYSNFSSMGVNSFQISSDVMKKKKHRGGFSTYVTEGKDITYDEARAFKQRFTFPARVGISVNGTSVATAHYASEKTNPNIRVIGVDEQYLPISDMKVDLGRDFSQYEMEGVSYVCIIGSSIAKKLFHNKPANAINQIISVGDVKYRVVGVTETKGGSMVMDPDNTVLVPLGTARSVYGGAQSYLISVRVNQVEAKEFATEEAEGLFRVVRKQPLKAANNFSIMQNDALASMLMDNIKYIRWSAVVIGIITLLGSVIGLMNIMLVSVSERTREIGVSKAMGARPDAIKKQFLSESVLISLMGGVIGVISGICVGNLMGIAFKTGFIVPWLWMMMGVTLCGIVGVISGIYPAIKASKMDPITALRYE